MPIEKDGAVISPEDYPGEVKRCLVELRQQRTRLTQDLGKINHERKKLQMNIRILTDKLAKISVEQAQKMQSKIELEKTITETEQSYARLIEASKGLYKTVNETKRNIPVHDTNYASRMEVRTVYPTGGTSPAGYETREDVSSPPLSSVSGVPKMD